VISEYEPVIKKKTKKLEKVEKNKKTVKPSRLVLIRAGIDFEGLTIM
jgi:hypothetical protein